MSEEWQPEPPEWQPPSDPGEFVAWVDNFVEQLDKYPDHLGISAEDMQQLREGRAGLRAEWFAALAEGLQHLRGRLRAVCPEAQWPVVMRECFARLPITREPERSRMTLLLAEWITAVVRAGGGPVRPVLTWQYFAEGIRLESTMPVPCERLTFYYRLKGRAAWQFLTQNTLPNKWLYTAPKYLVESEHKDWPGSTLEFVACGWFDGELLGFPSEVVGVVVPVTYPPPGVA